MTTEPLPLAIKFEILVDNFTAPDGSLYSLTEVSEATGVAINTLSRIKTGRIADPRLSTLISIIDFYGISLDYFNCKTVEDCYRFLSNQTRRQQTTFGAAQLRFNKRNRHPYRAIQARAFQARMAERR